MRRILGSLTGLLLALTGATVLAPAGPAAAAVDKDCGDFATQAQAQDYFVSVGGPSQDPDGLDADGDGVACESLPCPCSTATGGGGGTAGVQTAKVHRNRARIVRVVDGDTYDARLRSGRTVRVRVVGIDTPEVYGGVECGGRGASARAKRLLPRGTRVLLTSDPSQQPKDRYGRWLRYVAEDGRDIGRRLVGAGLARVYVYGGKPFQRVVGYRSAQRAARNAGRGVWGYC